VLATVLLGRRAWAGGTTEEKGERVGRQGKDDLFWVGEEGGGRTTVATIMKAVDLTTDKRYHEEEGQFQSGRRDHESRQRSGSIERKKQVGRERR